MKTFVFSFWRNMSVKFPSLITNDHQFWSRCRSRTSCRRQNIELLTFLLTYEATLFLHLLIEQSLLTRVKWMRIGLLLMKNVTLSSINMEHGNWAWSLKFTWANGVVNTLQISLFPASCFDADFIYFYNLNCPIISVYGNKEPLWTLAAASLSTFTCIQKNLITLFLLCRGLCFRAGCPGLTYCWVLWRSTVTFTFFSYPHLLINGEIVLTTPYCIFFSSLISGQCSGLKVFPSELKSNWCLWSSAHCALVCFALINVLCHLW